MSQLNEELIRNKFKNDYIYELTPSFKLQSNSRKLYYFKNCQIINRQILTLLNKIIDILPSKLELVNCVLNNHKIIMFQNSEILNIGYLNEDNEFIVEYFICSLDIFNSFHISKIFNEIKIEGYNFIKNYLCYDKIKFNI